ncbi:MAG: sugar ABC transporter substrate-binding protein [Caldilinea sp. CFX5]|nr:sugar ABC transporter substrate-binding protein [Caldilinea sp. CFX5]
MKRKMLALFGLLMVISLIITACPAPAGQPGATGATGGGAAAAGPTTIRISCWESGDALEPFNNAIKSFEAANPEIKVNLECIPQDYGTKLLAQIAAGNAPDIWQNGDGDVARYVAEGAVAPLDDYINGSDPLDMSVFLPGVASFGQVNGQTYYLTKDYSPLVLYYNKKLFDEAGVEYPTDEWTWDDLLAAAQALTKPDGSQWGIMIPNTWGDLYWLRGVLPIIYQNGGSVVSEDGTKTTGFMNSPETVAALQWYVDLIVTHKVAPAKADIDALAGADLFQTGKVAMQWTGRWPLKDYKANPDLSFGTAQLPAGPAGRANALCWAGFTLNAKSENKEAAWKFLKYIAAGDGAKEFANYALTAVKAVADEQKLGEDEYDKHIIADLNNVKPLPEFTTPKWLECGEKNFKAGMEDIFLNGASVQEAMDKAAADADACLAAN